MQNNEFFFTISISNHIGLIVIRADISTIKIVGINPYYEVL